MPTINMLSSANLVKGQGVASAYYEQVRLVKEGLKNQFDVYINSIKRSDIMHFHTINPNYYLQAVMERRRSASVGYVHFLPETVEESLKIPKIARIVFYKYIISFYKSMDYLVTVNPFFVEELVRYGIDRDKIAYIPNFVADDKFNVLDKEVILKERENYGIKKDAFVVLGVGQVQKRKGVTDFIEVAKQMPDVTFVWAGGFSFGTMTEGYKELKEIMESPPKNVLFPGIIDREYMNVLYNIADVMFLPSYSELFPMTILEAMCCKKPILLRDIDIYPQILFDYYLKAVDVKGFCSQIEMLKNSPEFYETWADRSWCGHNFYSRDSVLSRWDEFYNMVYDECVQPKLQKRSV